MGHGERQDMDLTNYAFWTVAGYTASTVIASIGALGVTVVAVQVIRLVGGVRRGR